jgi:hypothetical protein
MLRRGWPNSSPWSPRISAATAIQEKPPGGDDHSVLVPYHGTGPQVEVMAPGFEILRRRPRPRRPGAAPHVPRPPEKVTRAAILDIIPQHHLLNNVTRQWGTFSWHWFFMIQPYDFRAADGRRSRLFHREEAVEDKQA